MEHPAGIIRTYIARDILFSGTTFPYTDDTSFLEWGIVDSMNLLGLIMFVEEKFGLVVEDEDIVPDNFDSVNKLSAYITRKCQGNGRLDFGIMETARTGAGATKC